GGTRSWLLFRRTSSWSSSLSGRIRSEPSDSFPRDRGGTETSTGWSNEAPRDRDRHTRIFGRSGGRAEGRGVHLSRQPDRALSLPRPGDRLLLRPGRLVAGGHRRGGRG